ncbi:hypothetical protein L596_028620 [Steinernema carpocapsae]|uniref:Homeobox domain-containing protein n=1 Tax=Steinernema carpocapsae TaxID=34508 RepID=A0A4U5LYY7_STECR|nr:hypothetical protein L596_028620 [Steinernema carpocapsae]
MSTLTSTTEAQSSPVDASQLQAALEALKANPNFLQALGQASQSAAEQLPKRVQFREAQKTLLESLFEETAHPNRQKKEEVARKANLSYNQVKRWVQNQRYRMKRKPNESSPSSSYRKSV